MSPQMVPDCRLPELAGWILRWTPRYAAQALSRWRSLLNLGSPEKYAGHSVVFSQGDAPHEVFLLARGVVKLVFALPGDELFLALRYPGQFVDYCSHDLGVAYSLSGITIVTSEIQRISLERVQGAQLQNPDLRVHQADLLRRDLYDLVASHLYFKLLSPVDRLERLLWELAAVIGQRDLMGTTRLVLPLSNCEMASLCAMSESHYKSVRRELQKTGRVRHEGRCFWVLTRHSPDVRPTTGK